MARASIKISLTEGPTTDVSWSTGPSDLSFEKIAQDFEAHFLSPDDFMSVNTPSTVNQGGTKTIIRKSLVSAIIITEIKDFYDVLESFKWQIRKSCQCQMV